MNPLVLLLCGIEEMTLILLVVKFGSIYLVQ